MQLSLVPIGNEPMPQGRPQPKGSSQPFLFSGLYEQILEEAIHKYYFLTARQITRLLYPTEKLGNFTTIATRLKKLTTSKYLHSEYVPLAARQRPFYYYLGLQGKKYLETQGMEVIVYYEPNEQQKYWTMMHTLELNDFLIQARLIDKSVPNLTLYDFLHDFQIKKDPPTALKKDGKVVQPIPDGFLDFRYTQNKDGLEKTFRICFLVEFDRGTESDEKIRKKIRDYLTCFDAGELTEHFNAKKLTFLFVTSAGVRRVEKLRSLARLEFKSLGAGSDNFRGQMFKFAEVPPLLETPIDSKTLFCTPYWHNAYGEQEKHTLIEL